MRKTKTPKSVFTCNQTRLEEIKKELIDGSVTVSVSKSNMYTNLYETSHRL